jgi:hypothetical protein
MKGFNPNKCCQSYEKVRVGLGLLRYFFKY